MVNSFYTRCGFIAVSAALSLVPTTSFAQQATSPPDANVAQSSRAAGQTPKSEVGTGAGTRADIHISEVFKNWAQTVAIVVGGLWAVWKWGVAEFLRHRREIPALDGRLYANTAVRENGMTVATVEALWRNRGVLPVKLDTHETRVEIYALAKHLDEGPVRPSGVGMELRFDVRPLEKMEKFTLEPKTESRLQEHFNLKSNHTYLIRWVLRQRRSKNFWQKELLWNPSETIAPNMRNTSDETEDED
jgi:hypothetical protein